MKAFSASDLAEIIKAITSTNLGLQNALGNYAEKSSKAIDLLSADPHAGARLSRIEDRLEQFGAILNVLEIRTRSKVVLKPKLRRNKKK